MQKSPIEWTETTWNPVTGCTKVSPGCAHCYAERMAKRLKAMGVEKYRHGFGVTCHPETLKEPLKWKKPRKVFVCSMGDLFHEDVPDKFIDKVFAVMALCPQHTFQVLTKRIDRMAEYLKDQLDGAGRHHFPAWGCWCSEMATWASVSGARDYEATDEDPLGTYYIYDELMQATYKGYLPNVWLGTSVENADYLSRIDDLLECPAAVRFVSAEPLLGPLDLSSLGCTGSLPMVDWVIVGGESGTGARPMHPDWVRDIRNQCVEAGVPFFFKQWGEWLPVKSRDVGHWLKAGKKKAGRLLDGREWSEEPREQNKCRSNGGVITKLRKAAETAGGNDGL